MKYLAIIATMLLVATNAFAALTEAEKRQELEAARVKMEAARAEFLEARQKLDVDISSELEMAREAMDVAAEVFADVYTRGLDLGQHKVIEFNSDHLLDIDGGPQLGLIIGTDDDQGGVKLIGVTPGSGAQKAGLAAGDRVLEINGTQLKDLKGEQAVERLVGELVDLENGDLVNLVYESDGKIEKAEVAATSSKNNMWRFLGELGNIDTDMDFDIEFFDDDRMGTPLKSELELSDIDAVMGHYFGVKNGVLVIADSREENGFLPGDIIKSIDGKDIESAEDALKQLTEDSEDLHTVKVLRKGRNKNLDVAGIEERPKFLHSGFSWTDDENDAENKKIIVRRIGGYSPHDEKAARIVIEKKEIKTN